MLSLSENDAFGVTFIPQNTLAIKKILSIPQELEVATIIVNDEITYTFDATEQINNSIGDTTRASKQIINDVDETLILSKKYIEKSEDTVKLVTELMNTSKSMEKYL